MMITPTRAGTTSAARAPDLRLSKPQLARVTADIEAVGFEHGLTACFSLLHVLEERGITSDDLAQTRAGLGAVRIPASQWLSIARSIDAASERAAVGSGSVAIRDWVEFGPGVSTNPS